MATEKVGVYRKFHGSVPKDKEGKPLPKRDWPKKRPYRWAVRWFSSDGKRYSKSFKTRKEAEYFAEKIQEEVRCGKVRRVTKMTLKGYYHEHKQLMEGNVARRTLSLHLSSMELLADAVGWNKYLVKITVRDIERLRSDRFKAGIAPATSNKELKTLRRIFNLAIVRGYLPTGTNPCSGLPMLKVGSKRKNYIKPQEFRAIYSQASDTLWKALLTTFYTCGLRLREALNLTWQDIAFDEGMLHVTRRKSEGFVQAWTPKDHQLRTIPLPEQAVSLLTAWQCVAPEQCPYVFMDHGRWQYYKRQVQRRRWCKDQDLVNNILRRFKTLCRRAGVKQYTIHDIRRSCITNWAKRLPIHVVKELAGHSDIKTTQEYYLSIQPEDIAKAQKVQESLLGNIPQTDLTDPKLTHSGQKRVFPGRRGCQRKTQFFD